MKWKMTEARYGDIVRVSLGTIYHYGIFVSEDEVIQFGLPPTPDRRAEDVEVLSTDVSAFLAGGFLEVGYPEGREKKKRRSPEQTVAAARSRLGEKGYHILRNNCEHFANECAFGDKVSYMADGLRNIIRSIPIVHVYVERYPFAVDSDKILPTARAKEIESCSNSKVKEQKYYVWKLLENALMHSFGLKIGKLDIKKQTDGKWVCDECCFSLSHCDNLVAVAVSRKPVGVDIEKCDKSRFGEALAEKITTAKESEMLKSQENASDAIGALWTKKEAVFKMSGEGGFQPKNIEVSEFGTRTKTVLSQNEKYFISVASEDATSAIFRGFGEISFAN